MMASVPWLTELKSPADNDPAGESPKDEELAELQRMVSDNEKALSRAKDMISELRKHLRKEPARPSKTKKR